MNRSSTLLNDQTRLTTVRGQMTLRLGELEKELAEADAERERLETALHSREAALRAEEERQETLSADHRACVRRFDEADADLIRLRNEAEKLTAAQQSDQTRWRLLDEMTREMEGYSQSVRRAVQYARERRQQGVKGVLAQLISVPGEIETSFVGGAYYFVMPEADAEVICEVGPKVYYSFFDFEDETVKYLLPI